MNSTYAEINLKNLQYNYNAIRRKTKTKIMAVVKADAYGHGMIKCVEALSKLKNKPEYYGVAFLHEAIELREAKIINEPILCFAPFQKEDIKYYVRHNILTSVTTIEHVKQISKIKINGKIRVHININTGMNRLGIGYNNAYEAIVQLVDKGNIIVDGIYTHFATSDENDKSFANLQLKRFNELIEKLNKNKISYGLAHAANSGAVLEMPHSYLDMVRPGISLYGYAPSFNIRKIDKLKPVMALYSRLSAISKIDKGESVGYGRLFIAKQKTNCGTIPIGYADGLLRGLSDKIKVIVNNKYCKQIGRVSMDRISIILSDERIKLGTKVIILGTSKDLTIDAWDWSKVLNTIPYEIICSISKRVPRKYIGNV